MEQRKLILLLFLLVQIGSVLSHPCPMTLSKELAALKRFGGGPLGAFNKEYMALTTSGAHNFTNLVRATVGHTTFLVRKKRRTVPAWSLSFDAPFPKTNVTGSCENANKACSSCPATTDLGPDVIPRFINEVICEDVVSLCKGGTGVCITTFIPQKFLRKTGLCDANGEEILEEFTQQIRACCECFLF